MFGSNISQPALFDFSDSATSVAELFPAVWSALEGLTSPDADDRHQALDRLLDLEAPRLSPLVAYVLATRLDDKDIEFRFRVVQALGQVLSSGDQPNNAPGAVRRHIKSYISQLRIRGVYALLQVADQYPSAESNVAHLFDACSYAGSVLADIFSDRKTPIPIRRQAINFVGRVGFLDAVPALERLASRLEARRNGQRTMPFAPPSDSDEKTLLLVVQTALVLLKNP